MPNSLKEVVISEKDRYSFRPEIQIICFGILICFAAWLISDLHLFGHKSQAIFDIWTISHIATGAVLSFGAILMRHVNFHHPIMFVLLISLGWEVVEHYLEISNIAVLSKWFAGEENILNRLVADQIAVVAGFLLIKWQPRLLLPFIFIAAFVLTIHVMLGDSMYFFN